MPFRFIAAFAYLLVFTMIGDPGLHAQTIDPHELYEQRCSGCHATHASEFVTGSLARLGGKIVVRKTGKELRPFLADGHGRLAPHEIDAVVAHLTFILQAGGLFRDRCFICHGRAVTLARTELILWDDRLVGRYTGRDIATFLENHGRLEASEFATIVQMLKRQLAPQSAN